MATTPSARLSVGIAAKGLTGTAPLGGAGRVTRGYVSLGAVAPTPTTTPGALISSETVDANGIPTLLNSDIRAMSYVDVYRSPFFHPHSEYTGYAANGYWYTAGIIDPTALGAPGGRFQATWASEGDGTATTNRGPIVGMPRRILVIGTLGDVVILDADTLNVWMRFVIPVGAPAGNGPFLGEAGLLVNALDFGNGFLAVASSNGLRIADFRRDTAYLYKSAGSVLATASLTGRNLLTYFDGAGIGPVIGDNNCLSLDIGNIAQPAGTAKAVHTLCAVGHAAGLDGVTLYRPGLTYPSVKSTIISEVTTSAWAVSDDGDGDLSSPYLIDAGTNWLAVGVQSGDILTTDIPTTHRIIAVEQTIPGSRLKLDPELPLTASGASYVTQRQVPSVHLSLAGVLHFANGEDAITRVSNSDWFEGASPLFTQLTAVYPTARLSAQVTAINDIAVTGDGSVYAATALGVFYATAEVLTEGRLATFLYSTGEVTDYEAEFKVLEGAGSNCLAVAVDVETGDVAVSVDVASGSVVTEVNTTIHHPFRFFSQVGKVRSIVSFRNADGPPDEVI